MDFKLWEIIYDNGSHMFIVGGDTFTEEEFSETFIPSFCITVYKY